MIISYFPGAGGNRYLRMLRGDEWHSPHQGYDDLIRDQRPDHRYLYPNSTIEKTGIILTHCINTPLIKKICPEHQVVVILGNLQSCLRREWSLYGHSRYWQRIDPVSQDMLDLYLAVRDPSWPQIDQIEDIGNLPANIKSEFQKFQSATTQRICPVDPLDKLKKEYNDRLDSAYAAIQWHLDYYDQYPLDLSQCDSVIDLDGENLFASIMKPELDRYPSELFDRCWEALT